MFTFETKMFQMDMNSDLKEKPKLNSRCWFYIIWTGNATTLNKSESV